MEKEESREALATDQTKFEGRMEEKVESFLALSLIVKELVIFTQTKNIYFSPLTFFTIQHYAMNDDNVRKLRK